MIGIPILEVYHKFALPENLQLHMLRVAAVARQIQDNWAGLPLNQELITRVLLVHDIGNIVKIPTSETKNTSDEGGTSAFERVQQQMLQRFGTDDHIVSAGIARELGFSPAELDVLSAKVFVKNDLTAASPNFNLKVAAYADQRVAPAGVMPLLERLTEAKVRYKDRPGTSMNNPKTDYFIECAVEIEKQLQELCSTPFNEITNASIAPHVEALKGYKLICPL